MGSSPCTRYLLLLFLLRLQRESFAVIAVLVMEAVSRRAVEKADPLGGPRDRLVFNLFRRNETQHGDDYIGQECQRHSEAAFQAFYQAFLFGRFAHFAANSTIMESVSRGAGLAIRVVDFDLGDGVQWVPVIEAVAARGEEAALRLTSTKWEDDEEEARYDDNRYPRSSGRRFQDVSRRLCGFAEEIGVELKVEEMSIDELLSEAKKGLTLNGRREWIVFNCMVGPPHTGRKSRSKKPVAEFLKIAQDIVEANNCGIITLGQGDGLEKLRSCTKFSHYFDRCLGHYQAVLELMETEFPSQLVEARFGCRQSMQSPGASCGKMQELVQMLKRRSRLSWGV